MSFFILALGRVLRLLFLSHTHYFSIAWVLCLLFLSHTHYLSIAWVSHLFFLPHTHYISRAWVSHLFFLPHTHYISLTWVSCLLFLSHTHYISCAWVSHLFFLPHTHYNYLARNHIRIRDRTSIQQIDAAFVEVVGGHIRAFYRTANLKRSRAYARLLKTQINSMNESKLLCYSSHCLIVILCSYPNIVLIWVLLLLN